MINPACEKCDDETSNDSSNEQAQFDKNANIWDDQDTRLPKPESPLNLESFQQSFTSTLAFLFTRTPTSSADAHMKIMKKKSVEKHFPLSRKRLSLD